MKNILVKFLKTMSPSDVSDDIDDEEKDLARLQKAHDIGVFIRMSSFVVYLGLLALLPSGSYFSTFFFFIIFMMISMMFHSKLTGLVLSWMAIGKDEDSTEKEKGDENDG